MPIRRPLQWLRRESSRGDGEVCGLGRCLGDVLTGLADWSEVGGKEREK